MIAPGSIVRLNSGSPKLTVKSIEGDDVTVTQDPTASDPSPREMTFKAAMLTEEQEAEPVAKTLRKLVGLVAGRIVNYVMLDGEIRAMLVVNPHEGTGAISGLLFFDGIHDRMRHVRPLGVGPSGHAPQFAVLIGAVEFSEDLEPGTWHWPTKQAVMASSVDQGALATQLMEVANGELAKQSKVLEERFTLLLNDKLAAHLESVNELLDSHKQFVHDVANPSEQANLTLVHDHPPEVLCESGCPAFVAPTGGDAQGGPNPGETSENGKSAEGSQDGV